MKRALCRVFFCKKIFTRKIIISILNENSFRSSKFAWETKHKRQIILQFDKYSLQYSNMTVKYRVILVAVTSVSQHRPGSSRDRDKLSQQRRLHSRRKRNSAILTHSSFFLIRTQICKCFDISYA